MRKIESIFITSCLFATIAITGTAIWNSVNLSGQRTQYKFPETKYGAFLAAQHAVYVNDFDTAKELTKTLGDVEHTIVKNTMFITDFLGGKMPDNAQELKKEKSMPAQFIYDAYLVQNDNWKELHSRHKTDESALAAPLRIWPAIANNWRTNTFKFIDNLPTNNS